MNEKDFKLKKVVSNVSLKMDSKLNHKLEYMVLAEKHHGRKETKSSLILKFIEIGMRVFKETSKDYESESIFKKKIHETIEKNSDSHEFVKGLCMAEIIYEQYMDELKGEDNE